MLIVKIFYAFMLICFGFAILRYRKTVKSWTGNFVWAERYLGNGGTYFVIMLVGIFCIFAGILYPFGVLDFMTGSGENIIKK